jgi:hypothetical protein
MEKIGSLIRSILSRRHTERTTPFTMATIRYWSSHPLNGGGRHQHCGTKEESNCYGKSGQGLSNRQGAPMKGNDVKEWQKDVKALFKKMAIDCPIKIDGVYGVSTRSYSAALCHASGLSAKVAMKDGVTPELRVKLRNGKLTAAEKKLKNSAAARVSRRTARSGASTTCIRR